MEDQEVPASRTGAALPLAYADVITLAGVRVVREPGTTRIIVPPQWRWWPMSKGMVGLLLAILYCATMVALSIPEMVRTRDYTDLFPAVQGCVFVAGLTAFGIVRLQQWRIFEVSADRLVRKNLMFGRLRPDRTWPRQGILELRYSRISNKLVLRTRGKDMNEIAVTSNPQANQYVADQLNAAFAEIPSAALRADDPAIASPSSRGSRHYTTITIVMGIAVICLFFGPFGCLASGALMIGAAVVAGISGGTQEKFWT